jgi:hypothetical protein
MIRRLILAIGLLGPNYLLADGFKSMGAEVISQRLELTLAKGGGVYLVTLKKMQGKTEPPYGFWIGTLEFTVKSTLIGGDQATIKVPYEFLDPTYTVDPADVRGRSNWPELNSIGYPVLPEISQPGATFALMASPLKVKIELRNEEISWGFSGLECVDAAAGKDGLLHKIALAARSTTDTGETDLAEDVAVLLDADPRPSPKSRTFLELGPAFTWQDVGNRSDHLAAFGVRLALEKLALISPDKAISLLKEKSQRVGYKKMRHYVGSSLNLIKEPDGVKRYWKYGDMPDDEIAFWQHLEHWLKTRKRDYDAHSKLRSR